MAELSDPVVGGTHGWPFSASLRDLAEVGYTETEYLLSGDAQRYALADGSDYSFDVGTGYVLRESPGDAAVIVTSGRQVHEALGASAELAAA